MGNDLGRVFVATMVESYTGEAGIARMVAKHLQEKNPEASANEVVQELDRLGWGVPRDGRHLVPWETYLAYVLGDLEHDEFLWFCGVRKILGRQISAPSCSIGEGEG